MTAPTDRAPTTSGQAPLSAVDAPRSVGLAALLIGVGCQDGELEAVAAILRTDYGNPTDLDDLARQARAALARYRLDPAGNGRVDGE